MSPQEPPASPSRTIWLDGTLVPWEKATVHVLSHAIQRGSLIFDYMSVHETPRGAAVFRLPDHVVRFLRSAELVGLPLKWKATVIRDAVIETVRANPGAAAVKISAYLPAVEVDVVPMDDHVALAVAAYDPLVDVIAHRPGNPHHPKLLDIWIEKERRNRRSDIVPAQAKVAANYASPMMAKWNARRAGYDDILLVDDEGHVAEGPTTNVFWVDAEGTLRTPPEERVLHGVTRRSILELAKHDGVAIAESKVRPEELMQASEVFLTGTSVGVWPVASIDRNQIGDGAPGPVSLQMGKRFRQVASGGDPAFAHWLTWIDAPGGPAEA